MIDDVYKKVLPSLEAGEFDCYKLAIQLEIEPKDVLCCLSKFLQKNKGRLPVQQEAVIYKLPDGHIEAFNGSKKISELSGQDSAELRRKISEFNSHKIKWVGF